IGELQQHAKKSAYLDMRATLDLNHGEVTLSVTSSKWGVNAHAEEIRSGKVSHRPGPHGKGISDCMLFFAQRYRDGTLRHDSIKGRAEKSDIGNKELKSLIFKAWCEAFGLEAPDDAQLKAQGIARKGSQAALRDLMLAELRGGPAGLKKWKARTQQEIRKAG